MTRGPDPHMDANGTGTPHTHDRRLACPIGSDEHLVAPHPVARTHVINANGQRITDFGRWLAEHPDAPHTVVCSDCWQPVERDPSVPFSFREKTIPLAHARREAVHR